MSTVTVTVEGLNLPSDVRKWSSTVLGDQIVFVRILPDDSPDDPTDWDCCGKIHSFGRRHSNFIDYEEGEKLLRDPDAVALSYFEQSGCIWDVREGFLQRHPGCAGDFRWDGVSLAGVWLPSAELRKRARYRRLKKGTPERHEFMEQQAHTDCLLYTDYCNGWVYGYEAELYTLLRDEVGDALKDHDDYEGEDVVEDSCWGYYGWDDATANAKDAVERLLAGPEEEVA